MQMKSAAIIDLLLVVVMVAIFIWIAAAADRVIGTDQKKTGQTTKKVLIYTCPSTLVKNYFDAYYEQYDTGT